MGDQKGQSYFLIEGCGLVRFIALIVAVFAAIPIFKKVSYAFNHGFPGMFTGEWDEVAKLVFSLIIMLVAGGVALKGKFSIP